VGGSAVSGDDSRQAAEREMAEELGLHLEISHRPNFNINFDGGFDDFYPSEISGGMKKRAALARAIALDPKIVYCDEPSAGLDPISSKQLDDLILELNQKLNMTFVVVTHELASIFSIGNNSIFLDRDAKNVIGRGNPRELLRNPPNEKIKDFLTRGAK
jgi:phospholipid/cholesterol/gamma-HCH transport system ATP-binding protein